MNRACILVCTIIRIRSHIRICNCIRNRLRIMYYVFRSLYFVFRILYFVFRGRIRAHSRIRTSYSYSYSPIRPSPHILFHPLNPITRGIVQRRARDGNKNAEKRRWEGVKKDDMQNTTCGGGEASPKGWNPRGGGGKGGKGNSRSWLVADGCIGPLVCDAIGHGAITISRFHDHICSILAVLCISITIIMGLLHIAIIIRPTRTVRTTHSIRTRQQPIVP